MSENKKLKIAVATHKRFQMPPYECYFPLHVGKRRARIKGMTEYTGDDTGINISGRNPYFCELTGLYWMWKNLDADYLGMVHYRRYFRTPHKKFGKNRMDFVLREEEALELLEQNDLILPQKRYYIIETLYSHYAHTHYEEHLSCMRQIIEEKCADYLEAFDRVMKKRSAHMYNMFIARRDICDSYCQWLFPLLMELEDRTDPDRYSAYQARLIGRVGELLLDVWIEKNQKSYCELPIIYMEKINWPEKIKAFLKAKFLGRKYDSSF